MRLARRLLESKIGSSIRFVSRIGRWQLDRFRLAKGHHVIYCLGDSHVRMFDYLQRRRLLTNTTLRAVPVSGATALGMVNPNSKTNALKIFRRYIRFIPPRSSVLLMLGEVDCGFVIWYRAAKHRLPVDDQLAQSLANYEQFALALRDRGHENIIISSVPLPTIQDDQEWGDVANARREVKATLLERTGLTSRYNEGLRQFARKHGFDFLDFHDEMLDPVSGVVRNELRHQNRRDHHLSSGAMAPILRQKLAEMGFE